VWRKIKLLSKNKNENFLKTAYLAILSLLLSQDQRQRTCIMTLSLQICFYMHKIKMLLFSKITKLQNLKLKKKIQSICQFNCKIHAMLPDSISSVVLPDYKGLQIRMAGLKDYFNRFTTIEKFSRM